MSPRLKNVSPLPNYQLLLTFDNQEQRIFDMSSYLDKGIFAELKDENIFRAVRVSFDTIEWPNGADLCPEVLYDHSKSTKNKSMSDGIIAEILPNL
jgi:hypothetical protein